MLRTNKYLLLLILLILIFSIVKVNASEIAVEGLITEVDLDNSGVKINGEWYYLDDNSSIIRNGIKSSLDSIGPVSPGFYQLGNLNLNDNNRIVSVQVFYNVLEGTVKKISGEEGWFKLRLYQQDTDLSGEKRIYWENSYLLQPGDYLILTAAGDRLLKLVKIF